MEMVTRKIGANVRVVELFLELLVLSSVRAQQHHNVFYNTAPLVYRPYNENPRWRNFNAQSLRGPFNSAYYAKPPHAHRQLHSGPPNVYLASPYQTGAYYGPQYATATTEPPAILLEHINQMPLQQLSIQRPRQRQMQLDQHRRIAPQIVQQQRNEGNFYRELTTMNTTSEAAQRKHAQEYERPFVRSSGSTGNTGYVTFEHKVLHVTTERIPTEELQDNRKRRSFPLGELTVNPKIRTTKVNNYKKLKDHNNGTNDVEETSELLNEPSDDEHSQQISQKTQYFHDIFMHYADPQSIAYGHVERQPLQFAKRFESLNKGNRYRGEVTWADMKTGGYGTQHWDLAQGTL